MQDTPAGIAAVGGAPRAAVMQAPAPWRCIDFISDLHLHSGDDDTFSAWQQFMQGTRADAVFILGDLFDLWVGDDVINDPGPQAATAEPAQAPGFESRCAGVLAAAARRLAIYFLPGNRDFLLGPEFARASGMTMLGDPCALDFAGQRWLLSHGDALCLQDTDYMRFRAQVRDAKWQRDFLRQPLTQRQSVARALREQSEAHRSHELTGGMVMADLDPGATCDWLRAADATTLIHGHTHKPAEHGLANGLRRIVLSDWDASAIPVRAEVLRLNAGLPGQGASNTIERLAVTLA